MSGLEPSERLARRLHLALLATIAMGLGLWLWRVYGFSPMRIVEPGP